jgi:hypothetical protein
MLEERLGSPKLDAFNQRIVSRCYLEPFNREETQQYIQAQVKGAGGPPARLFAADAPAAVHQATDGVPRLINQLCDHALLLAFTRGKRQVTREMVEEAWADLQQLPAPWTGDDSQQEEESNVIEFGGLDDDDSLDSSHESASSPKTVPSLRVASLPDDASPNPAAQVAQIQQALASLDEDFQPAGSIGPEMELVFDDLNNPFSEEFDEEEIVVDRYTTVCRGGQEEHAQVFTRQESELLQPLQTNASDAPAKTVVVTPTSKAPQPVYPAEQAYQSPAARTSTSAVDNDGLIVVEDDYDDAEKASPPPPPRKPAPVRRQEYRQLFANLRRSC